jgi:hypothetical protein
MLHNPVKKNYTKYAANLSYLKENTSRHVPIQPQSKVPDIRFLREILHTHPKQLVQPEIS